MLDKLVIGEAAGLWKTVHTFAYFEEDMSIGIEAIEAPECICFNHDVGQQGGWYPHIFLALHGDGVEID